MSGMDRLLSKSAGLAGKTLRSLGDEGPGVTAKKVNWRLRQEWGDRRTDRTSPSALALRRAAWPRSESLWPDHVTVLAPRMMTHHSRRRLDQTIACAEAGGSGVTLTDLSSAAEGRSLIQLSSSVVLFQMPYSRRLADLTREAKRLSIPVFYQASGPVFSVAIQSARGRALGMPQAEVDDAVRTARRCIKALTLADHAIAGTQELAELMDSHVSGRSFVLPYEPDEWMLAIVRGIRKHREHDPGREGHPLRFGYESLSGSGDVDLSSISGPLARVLREHPGVTLRIAGPCSMPAALAGLGDQIQVTQADNLGERMLALSGCDVLVAPRASAEGTGMYDFYDPIHAAVLGLPLVSSPTAQVAGSAADHVVCDSAQEWESTLRDFVDGRRPLAARMGTPPHADHWDSGAAARAFAGLLAETR